MNTARRSVVVVLTAVAAILGLTATASAAVSTVGYDVSYPQCGHVLPSTHAFGVVGVNGGRPTTANPCLSTQLAWAWNSSGAVRSQPKAQLYLNTANPGDSLSSITTWPTTGSTPYGICSGTRTSACSWQYGWNRAHDSVVTFFGPAAPAAHAGPASYIWWLDVETSNSWQSVAADAKAQNRATLEGMTAYLASRGAAVGLYSTSYQWGQIVGSTPVTSNLAGRTSWLPGATTLSGATANCTKPALTPYGRVTLTQYVVSGLDRQHSCV
jgi:hypothetical protein